MAATKIRCERCLTECGDTADDGHVIEFYIEDDKRIHCEACVDGEVNAMKGYDPIPEPELTQVKARILDKLSKATRPQLIEASKVVTGGRLSDADYEVSTDDDLRTDVVADISMDGIDDRIYLGWVEEALCE